MYISRVKVCDNLYCMREIKKSAIKVNKDALLEYERLKQNDLFSTIKKRCYVKQSIIVFFHNVRWLSKHADNIGFTETKIKFKVSEALNFFNISFNNNENKFLTYRCRNVVAVLDKFDVIGVSIFSLSRNLLLPTEYWL